MGECGEYELLFTIKEKDEERFLGQVNINKLNVTKIGKIVNSKIRVLSEDGKKIDLADFCIYGRNYNSVLEYINELTGYINGKWKSS